MFYCSFTVNEVVQMLEDDSDFEEANIFIGPPDNHGDDTDKDSGNEDSGGSINNLTGNQLRASASVTKRTSQGRTIVDNLSEDEDQSIPSEGTNTVENSSDTSDSDATVDYEVVVPNADQRGRRGRPRHRQQHRGRGRDVVRQWVQEDIPDEHINLHYHPDQVPPFLQRDWEPTTLFELFFDTDVYDLIREQSVNYARQNGNHRFDITTEDVKLFIAILLLTGYACLPRRRMYWETEDDVYNTAVSKAMPRNKFEDMLRYLHLADNTMLDPADKMAKVRPLYAMVNERCLLYAPGETHLSIDESMVPYFGRHGCKQFIRGKPIRFGFKLWCLATRLGYCMQFEPYQGAGTGRHELGLGAGVVLDLIKELPNTDVSLYFDNLFTSVKLLDALTEKGIGGTGTLRSNRLERCPLMSQKTLAGMPRGSFDYRCDTINNTVVVAWNDNSVVYMATNCHKVFPTNRVQRWSRQQNLRVAIQQPSVIKEYNTYMGGVDRMDQNINTYRIGIRTKKWWWSLFAYLPDMIVQNCWLLYRMTPKYRESPLDLLEFRRSIVKTYLMRFSQRATLGRPIARARRQIDRVPNAVRFDGQNHFIQPILTQRRCALCGNKTTRICSKCNVALHDRCFANYHQ